MTDVTYKHPCIIDNCEAMRDATSGPAHLCKDHHDADPTPSRFGRNVGVTWFDLEQEASALGKEAGEYRSRISDYFQIVKIQIMLQAD